MAGQTCIVIVEDTPTQANLFEKQFSARYPDARIWRIGSECEFRESFGMIALTSPDVIVIDVIIKWHQPVENFPMPSSPLDRRRAGIRCQQMLAADERTQRIPVILCTVLTEDELDDALTTMPPNVKFLAKQEGLEALFDSVDEVLKRNPARGRRGETQNADL